MKIIGNQHIHLIIDENTLSDNMANCVLVIDSFQLGVFSSPTYLPSLIHSLRGLMTDEIYFNQHINADIFHQMVADGALENHFMFTLEETFDDFMKRCLRNHDSLYFYFKLYQDHFFDYPNIMIETPIIKVIPINAFQDFLNNIKECFTKL